MQSSLTDFFSSPRASSISTSNILNLSTEQSKSTPRRKRKRPMNSIGGKEEKENKRPKLQQMIIDAGQKSIGLEHCIKCGMVYSLGEPKDVEQHAQFHNRFTETTNFRVTMNQIEAWKKSLYNEDVSIPVDGFLFLIKATSNSSLKRKFEIIMAHYVNDELGYSTDLPIWDKKQQRNALVFIAHSSGSLAPFICGILLFDIVEEITLMPQQKRFKGSFLGVDRIWVHFRLRRKGIATFLLDSSRRILTSKMENKQEMSRTRVAFSDPSELGIKLAVNYVGGDQRKNQRYIIYSSPVEGTSTTSKKEAKLDKLSKKLGL